MTPHKNINFYSSDHQKCPSNKSIDGSGNDKYSIVMVGCGGVGKSSITLRFVYDEFDGIYDPTKADSYRKRLRNEKTGKICDIDILDTAGQEEYAAIRDNYYRSGEGFILVFSVTDRSSYTAISDFHSQICRATNDPQPSILLLGNKIDLLETGRIRAVSANEAESLTEKWGINCSYREVSAKTNRGIEGAFLQIIRIIDNQRTFLKEKKHLCKSKKDKSKSKKLFKCAIQ